jgi:hypothetical protein
MIECCGRTRASDHGRKGVRVPAPDLPLAGRPGWSATSTRVAWGGRICDRSASLRTAARRVAHRPDRDGIRPMTRPLAIAAALLAAAVVGAAPARGPLEVTRAFYRAVHAGNAVAATKLVAPDVRPALASWVRLGEAHRRLETAIAGRFGEQEAARVGYGNKVQAEVKALLGASERIAGAQAEVVAVDGRVLASLKRTRDGWKVELDDALASEEGRTRLAQEAEAAERAGRLVARRLGQGEYEDAAAALREFRQRVAAATGEARPPRSSPAAEGVDL